MEWVYFFFIFPAKVTAQNKTSVILSLLFSQLCGTQINGNFLMLGNINIDYKNKILI